MIRYCVVLVRKEELTHEEFRRFWRDEHLPLVLGLPGLVKAELLPTVDQDSGYDGVGLLYFHTHDDLTSALQSDQAKRVREHTGTFADSLSAVRLVVEDDWAR